MSIGWLPALALVATTLAFCSTAEAQRIGPAHAVGDHVVVRQPRTQRAPRLASVGDGYVLGFTDFSLPSGARLAPVSATAVGSPLPGRTPSFARISCHAGMCLGVTRQSATSEIHATRVLADGTLLDATPIVLAIPSGPTASGVSVAASATGFLVSCGNGAEVFAVPVSREGIPGARQTLGPGRTSEVACSPDRCAVAWYAGSAVQVMITDSSGAPLGGMVSLPFAALHVQVAWDGTAFAVTGWLSTQVRGLRVALDGTTSMALDLMWDSRTTPPLLACTTAGICLVSSTDPSVGTPALGLWAPLLRPLRSRYTSLPVSSVASRSSLACTSAHCSLAWQAGDDTLQVRHLSIVTGPFGSELYEVWTQPVDSDAIDIHSRVALSSTSDGRSVATFVRRLEGTTYEVVAHALDAAAAPVVGPDQELGPLPGYQVAMASAGTHHGVVWFAGGRASFARLSSDGALLEESSRLHPVPGPYVMDAAIAWNGTHYLVVTVDGEGTVHSTRFDAIGQHIDVPARILRSSPTTASVAVASDGAGFLVVLGENARTVGVRVGDDGVPVDPTAGFLIRGVDVESTVVAHDGTSYVVAWVETTGIRAARVSGGTVLDLGGTMVEDAADRPGTIAIAPYGSGTLLVWASRTDLYRLVIRGRELSSTWSFGPRFTIVDEPELWYRDEDAVPAVAGVAGGGATLGYLRSYDDGLAWASARTYARTLRPDHDGASCATGADCASTFCVAGICCDGACTGSCETCLAALGATADGQCGPQAAGTECRAASGACDVPELCDGAAAECPAASVDACDGGPSSDGGVEPVDAAIGIDGSVARDASMIGGDASTSELDAGTGGDPPVPATGCSCTTAAPGPDPRLASWLVMVAVVLAVRRRRRAHTAG